jgi:hypothetical protein
MRRTSRILAPWSPRARWSRGDTGADFTSFFSARLVGKLDATADRKAGVFRVDAIHEDVPFTKAMTAAVRTELKDLARWLALDLG